MTEQETMRYNAMLEILKQIDKIVYQPSKQISNDFERIRKLTLPWHDIVRTGR